MTDSKKPENQKWVVCTYIFDKKWVHFNRLWVKMVSIRMIIKLGPKNELQTLGFRTYSPLQRNPVFCILPYKMAMFTIEKNHLNIVEKLSFCHHLFVLMWGVSQWVLATKFSAVSKLFNFENCVILAHIRFNLKLSSLDIFESFDSASGSWLSDLSNDVSIIFQFWLLSELCQIFKC